MNQLPYEMPSDLEAAIVASSATTTTGATTSPGT